jgi:hypothetical protein
MRVAEFWSSSSIMNPKLRRIDSYVEDIKRMVTMCRDKRVYIPPTWLKPEQAQKLAAELGLPVTDPRQKANTA